MSSDFVEVLKGSISIVNVVASRVSLRKVGSNYSGLCPFHDEKTPSFMVNVNNNTYKCFGCGKSGDIITFVSEIEGLSFFDAIKALAERNAIEFPTGDDRYCNKKSDSKKAIYDINKSALEYFIEFLKHDRDSLLYFVSRGLDLKHSSDFMIGAAGKFNGLYSYLTKLNYSDSDILEAGLALDKGNGIICDKFRNRLIFPILDKSGRVLGFSGRGINDLVIPKYLNSPKTVVFNKSEALFNLYHAMDHIRKSGKVIMVEGNMDAISLSINGIKNVVAPMGTAITASHMGILWSLTKEVVIFTDGDDAGYAAAKKLANLALPLISCDKSVKFATIPRGDDPDSLVRKEGVESVSSLLDSAVTHSEFLFSSYCMEFGASLHNDRVVVSSPEAKARIINALRAIIESVLDGDIKRMIKEYYNDLIGNIKIVCFGSIGLNKNHFSSIARSLDPVVAISNKYDMDASNFSYDDVNTRKKVRIARKIVSMLMIRPALLWKLTYKFGSNLSEIFPNDLYLEFIANVEEFLDSYNSYDIKLPDSIRSLAIGLHDKLQTCVSESKSESILDCSIIEKEMDSLILEMELCNLEEDLKEELYNLSKTGDDVLDISASRGNMDRLLAIRYKIEECKRYHKDICTFLLNEKEYEVS